MNSKSLFKTSITMLMLLPIMFISCEKQDDMTTTSSSKDKRIASLSSRDERIAALSADSYEITERDGTSTTKELTTCNCSYIIDCIEYVGSNNFFFDYTEMNFFSSASCGGTNCKIFNAQYLDNPNCFSNCGSPSSCCNKWNTLPPVPSTFPFNCPVPKFSSFNAVVYAWNLNSSCDDVRNLKSWKITYRISCKDGEGCTNVSKPITYTGGGANFFQNYTLQLGGDCGCKPALTQSVACDPTANKGGSFSGTYTGTQFYTYPSKSFYACPNKTVKVFGDPTGVPNNFILRKNGVTIHSQWVGDSNTYPNGPWSMQSPIPYQYNYTFVADEANPSCDTYTLTVETVGQPNMTDSWNATVSVY